MNFLICELYIRKELCILKNLIHTNPDMLLIASQGNVLMAWGVSQAFSKAVSMWELADSPEG